MGTATVVATVSAFLFQTWRVLSLVHAASARRKALFGLFPQQILLQWYEMTGTLPNTSQLHWATRYDTVVKRVFTFESTSTYISQFCNFCGTQVVGQHLTGPIADQFVVNVRAIRDPYVNPFELEYVACFSTSITYIGGWWEFSQIHHHHSWYWGWANNWKNNRILTRILYKSNFCLSLWKRSGGVTHSDSRSRD